MPEARWAAAWLEEGKGSPAELTVEVARWLRGRCHFRLHFRPRRCLRHGHVHEWAQVAVEMAMRAGVLAVKAPRSSAAPKAGRAVALKVVVSRVVALRTMVRWGAVSRAAWKVGVAQEAVSRGSPAWSSPRVMMVGKRAERWRPVAREGGTEGEAPRARRPRRYHCHCHCRSRLRKSGCRRGMAQVVVSRAATLSLMVVQPGTAGRKVMEEREPMRFRQLEPLVAQRGALMEERELMRFRQLEPLVAQRGALMEERGLMRFRQLEPLVAQRGAVSVAAVSAAIAGVALVVGTKPMPLAWRAWCIVWHGAWRRC